MSAHTPGPWIVYPSLLSVASAEDGKKIADVCTERSLEEDAANALLVASAPELLRELDCLTQLLLAIRMEQPNLFDPSEIEGAQALIAKMEANGTNLSTLN